jgi:predicted NBD/HSP70 family sugar kinase
LRARTSRAVGANNMKEVAMYLRSHKTATRTQIAEALGLSFSTVSTIVRKLKALEIATETEGHESMGGRMPKVVQFEPSKWSVLTLDLTTSEAFRLGLVDLEGNVIKFVEKDADCAGQIQPFLSALSNAVTEFQANTGWSRERILGLGVAIPGLYDLDTHTVKNSTIPLLEGINLKNVLQKTVGLPVWVENDANLAAIAASSLYEHLDMSHALCIFIGQGLGLGIVNEGKIQTGAHGYAGEIAHMPFGDPSFRCDCGELGCIEGTVSLAGIERLYRVTKGDETVGLAHFFRDLAKNPGSVDDVLNAFSHTLGCLVTVLTNLFDPEVVFIYVAHRESSLLEQVLPGMQAKVGKRFINSKFKHLEFVDYDKCLLLKGAADVVFQKMFLDVSTAWKGGAM